jgi:multiple sugar transport system substrate-binding protein
MWAIPASRERDEEDLCRCAEGLAFINDHNIDWARTGHMAVRNSVLESEDYAGLPHRDEYTGTAAIARDTPPRERYGAIQDVLNRELAGDLADRQVGRRRPLADAELEVQDLLDR